ncbi:MAG: site-2 protease family protein [Thermoguttaceae bacterium]
MLLGVPVRIHPFFWLVTLFLGWQVGGAASLLIWMLAVLICILVHEFGHALAMEAYGFRPWIVLYGLGGLTCRDPRDGFRRGRSESLGEILIDLAGPAAGFLLAAMVALAIMAAGHGNDLGFRDPLRLVPYVDRLPNLRLAEFCNGVFQVCVLWGLVNLLPVYPLDGGQVAREVLLWISPRDGIRQSLWLSVFTASAFAAFALVRWQDWYVAIFFGYLAYSSYQTLRFYSSGGRWY